MRRLSKLLTLLAILVGAIATLSYGSGAQIAVRYFNPSFGAWWDAHEFMLMEGAAAALGMLVGVRLAARFIERAELRSRAVGWSLAVSALGLVPVARLSARLARMGTDGQGGFARDWLVGHFGYGTGIVLDKIFLAGLYFIRTAGFAFLAGLGLFVLVLAALSVVLRPEVLPERHEASSR